MYSLSWFCVGERLDHVQANGKTLLIFLQHTMLVQEQRCAIYPLSSTPTLRLWAIKITRSLIIELVLTHVHAHTQRGRDTVASHNIGSCLLMARGGSGVTYFSLKGGEEKKRSNKVKRCSLLPWSSAGRNGRTYIRRLPHHRRRQSRTRNGDWALSLRRAEVEGLWLACSAATEAIPSKMTHLKCSGGKKERKKALSASTLWKKISMCMRMSD